MSIKAILGICSVTKVTAAPFSSTAYSNPKALTATTAATATFDASANASFKLINKFNLFVVGQTDAAEEPTKSMTTWFATSLATRTTNSVFVSSNVSSFAIVVDVTTKALLKVNVYCGTSGTTAQTNDTTTALVTCTVGAMGNAIGFWI